MRLSQLMKRYEEIVKSGMPEYVTIERYVGQFNPEAEERVSHKTPSLFYNLLSAQRTDETKATYDLTLQIATVLVRDDLIPLERDILGWDDVENLNIALEAISNFGNQANTPRIVSINKTDRVVADTNAGYSYWSILFELDWRLHGLVPGSY